MAIGKSAFGTFPECHDPIFKSDFGAAIISRSSMSAHPPSLHGCYRIAANYVKVIIAKKTVRHKTIENRIVPVKTVRGRIATINLEIVLDDATNKMTYYVDYTEGLHLRIEGFQDYLSENQSRHLTLRTRRPCLLR